MLTYGRDYTRSVAETRRLESNNRSLLHKPGDTLLGWPEYQKGQVAVVFATLFVSPMRKKEGDWDAQCYVDINQANQLYRKQVDVYHRLVEDHPRYFQLLTALPELEDLLLDWEKPRQNMQEPAQADDELAEEFPDGRPVGLVILMEGAEGVRSPSELEEWWQMGVRIIGPAWVGNRFCGGTHEPGPLTREGYALLEAMASFGFTLDISHMDEKAVLQALDYYPGPIIASHANALSLLKGSDSNRHLSDRVIQGLFERNGIIGTLPVNRFLQVSWNEGDPREMVSINKVVAQIDTICQMAGDPFHAAIGSDFDGGFGLQSIPAEMDSIADLQKLAPLLADFGYPDEAIAAILGGNWLRLLKNSLPQTL